jgi:hypothetical protein
MEKKWLTTKQKAEEEQLSTKQVIRRAKMGLYPGAYQLLLKGEWRFPAAKEMAVRRKALTDEEIVIEEGRKEAVLKHHHDLGAVASRWESTLWLPPPWHWDLPDLHQVFYLDSENQKTGYKLPSQLVNGEEPKGHFRKFWEGCVYWAVQQDGSIILKLPVEGQADFCYLEQHSQESPAWGLFAQWKEQGGSYIQLCASLFARIDQDAKRATGAKSDLFSWVIYHDAFCIKATELRCDTCGGANSIDSRQCQECGLSLGWLRPIGKDYERATDHPKLSPIHIHGWGNIEKMVETTRFEGMKRGHKVLKEKYQGCDLVETILERETEVKQVEIRLSQELVSLSRQKVFLGKCLGCPVC